MCSQDPQMPEAESETEHKLLNGLNKSAEVWNPYKVWHFLVTCLLPWEIERHIDAPAWIK